MSVASRSSALSNIRPLDPDLLQELLTNARREICGSDSEATSERSTPTNIVSSDNLYYSAQANAIASESAEIRRRALRLTQEAVVVDDDVAVTSLSRPSTSESVGSQRQSSNIAPRQPQARSVQSPRQQRNATSSASFLPEIDPQGRMSTQRSTSGLSDTTTSTPASTDGRNSKPLWKQSNSKSSSKLDAGANANSEHHPRMPRPPKHKPKIKRNNSESVL